MLSFGVENITARLSINSYMSFFIMFILFTGLIFQLPLIIYFLLYTGLITVDFLRKKRVVILVLILFMSALITPPDIVTQVLVAMPAYLLFELSILVFGILKRNE